MANWTSPAELRSVRVLSGCHASFERGVAILLALLDLLHRVGHGRGKAIEDRAAVAAGVELEAVGLEANLGGGLPGGGAAFQVPAVGAAAHGFDGGGGDATHAFDGGVACRGDGVLV